ncbi:N-6 DNA methylase [[Bacillus] enclensis]|uniref:site-specific DNA-methyltransferase (adenine-specific) n=1 Tax=[Bacillus] enclensis TaxID=1402860 RepID=A0A0V8HPU8_9BACI|nr:class I SAM-dependent DNA methyltransferase [[Bacillus] enclensis]KSU64629.1 N-6 DNA methylase [[Bacillus] enclensis]SCB77350.1 type I restriction enzyme M protein [[Bacillus] enclensis]
MTKSNFTKVMLDETSMNVNKEVSLVFSIANTLRGTYKSDKYKDVIIPMIIIRRIECALASTKDKVVELFEKNPNTPSRILERASGFKFYNTSRYTLKELLNDSHNIATNFNSYIESFSSNIQEIIRSLDFEKEIMKMDKNNRLLGVVKKFSELDLDPETIDGIKMGYMFEEIIQRFSENAEAGDHYTPREVIRLLVNIMLAEGCDDLFNEGKITTVLDMACGTGGMLSTTYDFVKRMNSDADIRLFGQEINPESYAICLADMLIKGQNAENIRFQDTMKNDCFDDQSMRIVIANPPFGTPWGGKDAADGVEKAVKEEFKRKNGRFSAGLPSTGDMQLLFMQHAIYKMDENFGRAAIITNGSPLFSGNTTSGESQIRRYMLENDLIEAIIALPSDLFYNTNISIYAFILSKNKRPERKGKVQLINAVDFWKPLKKSLGKKRKEISREDIKTITEIYASFKPGPNCKVLKNEEFMYKEYAVYQPLQRTGSISIENIDRLKNSPFFTSNAHIFNETDFEVLSEMNPRSAADEKKFKKHQKGKKFTEEVITILSQNASEEIYKNFSDFERLLKKILNEVEGITPSRLRGIAMELSVMDKTAVIQKDSKGRVLYDPSTKDVELVKLTQDIEEYFKTEVYPYVPDAHFVYEFDENKKASASNKEKLGAEFSFTRFFYKYKEPEKAENLLNQFIELEKSLTGRVANLIESEFLK